MFLPIVFLGLIAYGQSDENEINKVQHMREHMKYKVLAYPNPSQGNVHIDAPEGAICQLVSSSGSYIGTWEVREKGIDFESLPTGSYIVTINFNQSMESTMFVVL